MHFTGSPPHRRMVSFSTGTKRVTYSRKSPWHSQRTLLQADLCWLGVYLGRCAVYNPKAETELFEKRSANYAGRPPLVGFRFAYIMSAFHMAHMPYSDRCWSMEVGFNVLLNHREIKLSSGSIEKHLTNTFSHELSLRTKKSNSKQQLLSFVNCWRRQIISYSTYDIQWLFALKYLFHLMLSI